MTMQRAFGHSPAEREIGERKRSFGQSPAEIATMRCMLTVIFSMLITLNMFLFPMGNKEPSKVSELGQAYDLTLGRVFVSFLFLQKQKVGPSAVEPVVFADPRALHSVWHTVGA